MEFIQIEVQEREARGTNAMRKLRQQGLIPAVVYGANRKNLPITIPAEDLGRFLRSGSHLVELRMADQARDAILREVQVEPTTDQILHVDFLRVEKDSEVEDHVPVVFKGHAKGVNEGGLFQSLHDRLVVMARPRDLPREIVVDINDLGLDEALLIRDMPALPGVKYVLEPDEIVAHVVTVRESAEGAEDEGDAGAEPGPSEPEVIRKGEGDEG